MMDKQPKSEIETVEEWTHNGVLCKINKHPLGHYTGYVKTYHYESETYPSLPYNVHGGLTYGPDEDGWIGFDCAHFGDTCIDEDGEMWGHTFPRSSYEKIWKLNDVKEETEYLAEQIK